MTPIREDDLHAYVDGSLDAARRLEVEAWLADHGQDAERVRIWTAQNQALHTTFDPVLNEALPQELVRAALRPRTRPALRWQALAATVVLTLTGLLGYEIGLRSTGAPSRMAQFTREAALAHVVYVSEQRHPVEVEAAHAYHLLAWLSKRLGKHLAAPDFAAQGFELMGGRLLPGGTGAVAQFMYQDAAGRRITLYVRRDAWDGRDTAFRHGSQNGVEEFYWIDHDMGYVLSGEIDHATMQRLADSAYRQVEAAK